MINEDVRQIIKPELRPDEVLLWADKPTPIGLIWQIATLAFLLLFFWILFGKIVSWVFIWFFQTALFSGIKAVIFGALIFILFGIFPLLCLYPGIRQIFLRHREIYAITTERTIICELFWPKRVFKIKHSQIRDVSIPKIWPKHTISLYAKMDPISFTLSHNSQLVMHKFKQRWCRFYMRGIENPVEIKNLIKEQTS